MVFIQLPVDSTIKLLYQRMRLSSVTNSDLMRGYRNVPPCESISRLKVSNYGLIVSDLGGLKFGRESDPVQIQLRMTYLY